MTIVIVRILTPDDYGLMAIALLFVNFAFMLNQIGLGAALVQMPDLEDELVRKVYSFILLVNFCLFSLLFLIAPWIADFFDEPRVTLLIRVLSVQFLLAAFELVPMDLLERELQLKKKAFAQLSGQVTGGVTTLLLALSGYGVWSLVIGTLVDGLIRAIGMNIAHFYIRVPTLSLKGIAEAMKFGGFVTGERLLWFAYNSADSFIIGKLLGKTQLGLYTVAMQISSMPMYKTGEIIYTVAFPAFSRANSDPESVRHYFLKAFRLMAFLAFPLFWGMSAVSQELIDVLLGERWTEAGWIMQLLCLMMPLRMLSNLLPPILQAVGRPDLSFRNLIIAVVAMPVAFLLGVNWGLIGVCLAWIIVFPVVVSIMLWTSLRVLEIPVSKVTGEMFWPVLNAGLMYLAVWAVGDALPDMPGLVRLVLMSLSGAIVYVGVSTLTARATFTEFMSLVRSV